jgi:Peptidase propeptide and YPEB domain
MKPDLNDDFDLERRLRDSVAGRRPNAPAGLHDFIREVPSAPVVGPDRLGFGRSVDRRRMRRGVAGVAVAAAIALAFAASAALVSIRQSPAVSQSPNATSATTLPTSAFDSVTGDWGWRRVADPAPGAVAPVTNGYLGECLANGAPAACTSRDGVAWTLPPDPAVLTVDDGGVFAGWSVAHGSTGWVAVGTVDPGTWHSSDGVHWSKVAVDLPGLQHAQVQALPAGFAMLALANNGGQPAARLLISTDGASWTPVDLPAGISEVRLAGAVGLVGSRVESGASVAGAVSSADGLNWTALTLPDGVGSLSTTIRLASGTYVGVGTVGTMVTSTDGVTWRASAGPGSPVDSLALVGARLVAIAKVPSTDVSALWESPEGTTWQRVALLDGNPLSGTQLTSLGDRIGVLAGSKLTMIGWPGAGGSATATATPTAIATPATPAPKSTAPAVIVGGWRWHQLSGGPDGNSTVVRVTNGYFGRCGSVMCSSPNGWSWQTPADPAIFATQGVALFTPTSVAHNPSGGYVVSAAEGVWYSLDGVHWQPSQAPASAHGFRAIMYGPSGFTLVGETPASDKSQLYGSSDGAAWTDAGLGPMVITLAEGETSGGIFTQTGKSAAGGVYGYSPDGRTWVTATQPADTFALGRPYLLSDGSLIMSGDTAILRSTDGRVWTKMKPGLAPSSLAMAGGRIVATVSSDGPSVAWESSDGGKTFRKLMDGATQVEQFGDLVLLRTSTGSWVGAPLGPSESPGTTPTATGLPESSAGPAYTPPPTPLGGISKEEAIRIAVNAVHPPADQAAKATAGVEMDSRYGRWIWSVSFLEYYGGPLMANGTFVYIDFYTGEVLASGNWVS